MTSSGKLSEENSDCEMTAPQSAFIIMLALTYGFVDLFVKGATASWLWEWYIIPLSISVPSLGWAQFAGLLLIKSFVSKSTKVNPKSFVDAISTMLAAPIGFLVTLWIAWLIHLFM